MLAEKAHTATSLSRLEHLRLCHCGRELNSSRCGQSVLLARLLRVFRVLRLVSIVPELRVLMNAFLKALPRMGYVALFHVHYFLYLRRRWQLYLP